MKLFNILIILAFVILIVDVSSKKKHRSSKRDGDSKNEVFKLKFVRRCIISSLEELAKNSSKGKDALLKIVKELTDMTIDENTFEKQLSNMSEGAVSKMMVNQSQAAVSMISNQIDKSVKDSKVKKEAQNLIESCQEKMMNLGKNRKNRKH